MKLKPTRNICLTGQDPVLKRQEIKTYFNTTFDTYELLFEILKNDEAFYYRADRLRHPLIFYFGHTAVFFINKLIISNVIHQRIDPTLESIFAVGVDEMSWDDLNDKHYDWPTVEETKHYRDQVRAVVNELIDTLPLTLPISWELPFWTIMMGIEHERIHLETSSVLIRQLPLHLVSESDLWDVCLDSAESLENELIAVQGGQVTIAQEKEHALYYGWDNEYGYHQSDIPHFKASKYLVSNGEFIEFVKENGYENDLFWDEEGIEWRNFTKATCPTFWIKEDSSYKLRHMTKVVPLPLNHPVEVNYLEAKAFCVWLGHKKGRKLRLPTEDEWYRLADFCGVADEPQWEDQAPANINLEHYASTVPVDCFAHGDFYDVIGNVWQWSETPIYPYEGFEVHPAYDDFSLPTFDNNHNLIKGGSWISTGNEALRSARYAFRRHFFQHAGFRYVESSYEEIVKENSYESDTLISQYAEFGWGASYFDIPNYPQSCAQASLMYMQNRSKRKALDIGCALGRSSFELARGFDEVTGVDFTARFIQLATRMKEEGELRFTVPVEGEIVEYKSISLKSLGLEAEAGKVSFWQADACNLKPLYKGYDLVFAGNLIDRLYDPKKFLEDVHHRINSGGLFIMTSPYTWLEEFTPKEAWLGGIKKDGENFTTLDGLKEVLGEKFTLIDTKDVPFVIRESVRKYQHTIAQMSVWEKK
ncbi:MAG: 5-histidylcysteine sulfoxide synthase [Epsilonproteobacteria bacterium]|nr:5-histidylcysteine sulfoxide synthase [Campylobacterota bacterium]